MSTISTCVYGPSPQPPDEPTPACFRDRITALPLPLLITGVAGVAGYNALDYFRRRYPDQVIAMRQRDNWRLVGPAIVVCNAEDRAGLARLFEQHRFRSVLDCAGNCASSRASSIRKWPGGSMSKGCRNLVDVAEQYDAGLVHLSVDLVYSGVGSGGHVETDPTDPVTVYGETMVAAEELILARAAGRLHLADLAADGNQLQRPRRRHRLDRLAIQKRKAGDVVLRRNPHAFLHRLLELAVRNGAGQPIWRVCITPAVRWR